MFRADVFHSSVNAYTSSAAVDKVLWSNLGLGEMPSSGTANAAPELNAYVDPSL